MTPLPPLLSSLLVALVLSAGCKRTSDEDLVRAVIDRAIEAANEKKASDVVQDAAEDFKGPRNMDVAETRRLLLGFFFRKGWVRTFPQNTDVTVDGDNAQARLKIAVAQGNELKALEDLVPTNATMLQIDLTLKKIDGDWKFTTGDYRRVPVE